MSENETAAQRMQARRDWRALREEDRTCEHCGFHSPRAMICEGCEAYSKGFDAGRASAETLLATAVAERDAANERAERMRTIRSVVDEAQIQAVLARAVAAEAERDAAVRERDNIETRIIGCIDAALVGAAAVPLNMSHEVTRLVNAMRVRERMLATATARAEAAGCEMRLLRDRPHLSICSCATTPLGGYGCVCIAKMAIDQAAAAERERIAAWLERTMGNDSPAAIKAIAADIRANKVSP